MKYQTEDQELTDSEGSEELGPIVEPSYEELVKIVEEKQYKIFRWENGDEILVDMQTANVVVSVYAALGEENKAKAQRMIKASLAQFKKTVDIFWKAVR